MSEEWLIESALDEAGRSWKRREAGWVMAGGPVEVHVVKEGDGVRVEAVLASWDALGPDGREALQSFLGRAEKSLRVGRCELREKGALVRAYLEGRRVEAELGAALAAVAAAAARLAREAAALTTAEVAAGYRRFFAGDSSQTKET